MSNLFCWTIGEDTIINNMFAATGAKTIKYSEENKYISILRQCVGIGKHSRNSIEIIGLSTIAYNMNVSPFPDTTRGLDPWDEVFSRCARQGGAKIELIKYPNFNNPKAPPTQVMVAEKIITMEFAEDQVWWNLYHSYCYERSTKDNTARVLAAFICADEEFAKYYNNKYLDNKK